MFISIRRLLRAHCAHTALGDTNRRRTLIDILCDDSILIVFYHCRPVLLEEYGSDIGDVNHELLEGGGSRCHSHVVWDTLAQLRLGLPDMGQMMPDGDTFYYTSIATPPNFWLFFKYCFTCYNY
jgi:hypothetical protein